MEYNYIETYILNDMYLKNKILDLKHDSEFISNVLYKLDEHKIKFNKREFKIYKKDMFILENFNNEKNTTYIVEPIHIQILDYKHKLAELRFNRKKIKAHSFPYDMNIDSSYHVKNIQFKLGDIYFNVDSEIYEECIINKMYFCGMVEDNESYLAIRQKIENLLKTLDLY